MKYEVGNTVVIKSDLLNAECGIPDKDLTSAKRTNLTIRKVSNIDYLVEENPFNYTDEWINHTATDKYYTDLEKEYFISKGGSGDISTGSNKRFYCYNFYCNDCMFDYNGCGNRSKRDDKQIRKLLDQWKEKQMKEFTKDDLKNGAIVKTRSKSICLLLTDALYYGNTQGRLINLKTGSFLEFYRYANDLKHKTDSDYDIVAVCQNSYVGDNIRQYNNSDFDWIWERKEDKTITLTPDEAYNIVKNLPDYKDKDVVIKKD